MRWFPRDWVLHVAADAGAIGGLEAIWQHGRATVRARIYLQKPVELFVCLPLHALHLSLHPAHLSLHGVKLRLECLRVLILFVRNVFVCANKAVFFAMTAGPPLVALGFSGSTTVTGLLSADRLLTIGGRIAPMLCLVIRIVYWAGPRNRACGLRM